jgi:DNA-binding beta-propeller fold protein YncE
MLSAAVLTAALVLPAFVFPTASLAKDKKKQTQATKPAPPAKPEIDITKLVWPGPPNIPRIRYVSYFAGQKIDQTPASEQPKQKSTWMDRMAGVENANTKKLKQLPFQLLAPYGMGINSKGELLVADQKVGALFIFNTETRDAALIRNGFEATFGLVNGIAIDDDDRMFVTDGKLHRVLILDKKGAAVDQIKEGLVDPVGIAIDTENRQLYVVDTQQDAVFVYDADTLKKIRRIGAVGPKHEMTAPGDFAAPYGIALDSDRNVYVTDMLNNRVETFDADGKFISQFGRHCDGPGCFARPKGIAVDGDGHIWVADPMLDILQVFDRDGQLLAYLGGHGDLPGQFASLVGVAFDPKTNRVFTAEQFPGRVQVFRYITDLEAEQLKKEKEAQRAGQTPPPTPQTAEAKPAAKPETKN